MKIYLLFFTLIFSIATIAQDLTYEEWQLAAESNIRLQPKYGNAQKTNAQIEADIAFIEKTMSAFDTRKKASDEFIRIGYKYLYDNDFKTAMYRFNQAYLLDPNNANIYLGYGTIYMLYKQYELSKQQYIEGLEMDPENARLYVDYGNTYLVEYYFQPDEMKNVALLDSAIVLLSKSYAINPNNFHSSMKLSGAFMMKGDCEQALNYYMIAEAIKGGDFAKELRIQIENECLNK